MMNLQSGDAPTNIVIVRALRGLGDWLCAVPAWRAMRMAWPKAHVAVVGLPETQGLAARFGAYLDALIPFPGFPGIAERPPAPRDLPHFLTTMHAHDWDLAVQMHGSGPVSNIFTALLAARTTVGFALPGQPLPEGGHFLPYPAELHEVRRNLALVAALGIPADDETLEFPIVPGDEVAWQSLRAEFRLDESPYVCLHPGAHEARRRWAPAHFAALGDRLAERGLRVVLTGTADESPLTAAVAHAMRAPALDLAGRTTLGTAAMLLREARLLVCNDTGISHLAAAVGAPSVVIFLASDPRRWAPLNRQRHRAVGAGLPDGAPQGAGEPPTLPAVMAAAEALLMEALTHVA